MEERIGIMGEYESIAGFRALGLSARQVSDPKEAEEVLGQWAEEGYAVVFITEELAETMGARLAAWRLRYLPAVTVIPSARKEAWLGKEELRTAIRKATGIDMIGQRQAAGDRTKTQETD